jgi:hypothetical protein
MSFILLINANYMKIVRSIQNLSFSYPMTKNMKLIMDYLCEDSHTTLRKCILNGKNKYERKIFLKIYL